VQSDGAACGQAVDAFHYALGIEAEMPIEVADGAGLAEMLDPNRDGAVACD